LRGILQENGKIVELCLTVKN